MDLFAPFMEVSDAAEAGRESGFQRVHATDPQTSHEAAAKVMLSPQYAAHLLDALADTPKSDEEILAHFEANIWAHTPSGLRGRRHELASIGLIADSGERRATSTGRKSIVWKITQRGRNVLSQLKEGLYGR